MEAKEVKKSVEAKEVKKSVAIKNETKKDDVKDKKDGGSSVMRNERKKSRFEVYNNDRHLRDWGRSITFYASAKSDEAVLDWEWAARNRVCMRPQPVARSVKEKAAKMGVNYFPRPIGPFVVEEKGSVKPKCRITVDELKKPSLKKGDVSEFIRKYERDYRDEVNCDEELMYDEGQENNVSSLNEWIEYMWNWLKRTSTNENLADEKLSVKKTRLELTEEVASISPTIESSETSDVKLESLISTLNMISPWMANPLTPPVEYGSALSCLESKEEKISKRCFWTRRKTNVSSILFPHSTSPSTSSPTSTSPPFTTSSLTSTSPPTYTSTLPTVDKPRKRILTVRNIAVYADKPRVSIRLVCSNGQSMLIRFIFALDVNPTDVKNLVLFFEHSIPRKFYY